MKPLFILLLLFVPFFSIGQDSLLIKSKYEEFSSRTGTMVKTETFLAGTLKDYKVQVLKTTDVETSISAKAVLMSQSVNYFLVGKITTSLLYIDWEEVPGFIKALKFQLSLLESKPANDVSYTYTTTNGVESSCTFYSNGQFTGWNIAFSRVYKYSRAYMDGSTFMIKKKDFIDIIAMLEQGISKEY